MIVIVYTCIRGEHRCIYGYKGCIKVYKGCIKGYINMTGSHLADVRDHDQCARERRLVPRLGALHRLVPQHHVNTPRHAGREREGRKRCSCVSNSTHRAQSIAHRAQSTEHSTQSTAHRAQHAAHRAQRTEHRAQSTAHRAQHTTLNMNVSSSPPPLLPHLTCRPVSRRRTPAGGGAASRRIWTCIRV